MRTAIVNISFVVVMFVGTNVLAQPSLVAAPTKPAETNPAEKPPAPKLSRSSVSRIAESLADPWMPRHQCGRRGGNHQRESSSRDHLTQQWLTGPLLLCTSGDVAPHVTLPGFYDVMASASLVSPKGEGFVPFGVPDAVVVRSWGNRKTADAAHALVSSALKSDARSFPSTRSA